MPNMLVLSLIIGALVTFPSNCSCAKASDVDVPHEANETIEINGSVVKNLTGTVFLPGGEAAEDLVVEVYDVPKEHPNSGVYEIVGSRKRRTACVTSTNGTFCFSDLPAGKYLLKVGTRQQKDFNALYVRVTLDRNWFRGLFRRAKTLSLTL